MLAKSWKALKNTSFELNSETSGSSWSCPGPVRGSQGPSRLSLDASAGPGLHFRTFFHKQEVGHNKEIDHFPQIPDHQVVLGGVQGL